MNAQFTKMHKQLNLFFECKNDVTMKDAEKKFHRYHQNVEKWKKILNDVATSLTKWRWQIIKIIIILHECRMKKKQSREDECNAIKSNWALTNCSKVFSLSALSSLSRCEACDIFSKLEKWSFSRCKCRVLRENCSSNYFLIQSIVRRWEFVYSRHFLWLMTLSSKLLIFWHTFSSLRYRKLVKWDERRKIHAYIFSCLITHTYSKSLT